MFRFYGILGLIMILLAEVNFYFKLEPFATWYFPIVWFGYIFVIDSLIYMIKNHSCLMNHRKKFLVLLVLSSVFWWIFEFLNVGVTNWAYDAVGGLNNALPGNWLKFVYKSIAFSTVLPAVLETYWLIRDVHLFDNLKLRRKHKISKTLIYGMMLFGIFALVAPLLLPKYFFPLVWVSFFFLLDPINYLHKQPSIISHLKDRKLKVPFSLMLAGLIAGFFWEFWNYWAVIQWHYNVPFVGFFKIFEMPVLGYLGYLPFALELYAMYYFVIYLYKREVKVLKLH